MRRAFLLLAVPVAPVVGAALVPVSVGIGLGAAGWRAAQGWGVTRMRTLFSLGSASGTASGRAAGSAVGGMRRTLKHSEQSCQTRHEPDTLP